MFSQQKKNGEYSSLTINIETVLIQSVGAQLSDTMGQLAQLQVQLLSGQALTYVVRVIGANCVHSSGFSILPGTGERVKMIIINGLENYWS